MRGGGGGGGNLTRPGVPANELELFLETPLEEGDCPGSFPFIDADLWNLKGEVVLVCFDAPNDDIAFTTLKKRSRFASVDNVQRKIFPSFTRCRK